MQNTWNKQMLKKQLCASILIVSFFAVVIGVLYFTNLSTAKRVENMHIEATAERGVEYLEQAAAQINAVALQIASDSDVQLLAAQLNPASYTTYYKAYQTLKKFDTYSLSSQNHSVSMLVLHLKNGLVFHNGRLFCNTDSFYHQYLEYEGLSQAEWLAWMDTKFQFWSACDVKSEAGQRKRYLTYNALMPFGTTSVRLCALISEEDLLANFLPEGFMGEAFVRIVSNRDGSVLYESSESIPRENAYLIERTCESLNLTVTVGIPPQIYAENVSDLKNGLLIFVLISGLVLFLAELFLAMRTSRPFLRLSAYLVDNGYDGGLDPVDNAIRSLSHLDGEKKKLDGQMENIKSLLRKNEFKYLTSAGAAGSIGNYEIEIHSPHVVAMLQSLSSPVTASHLVEFWQEENPFAVCFETPDHLVVILYSLAEEESFEMENLREALIEMCARFQGELRCAVSSPFDHVDAVRSAYLEADYTLHKGDFEKDFMISFQEIEREWKNDLFTVKKYHALDAGLNGEDSKPVEQFFDDLEHCLKKERLSLQECRQVFYLLRLIVYEHLSAEKTLSKQLLADTADYYECRTIFSYLRSFRQLSVEIVRENRKNQTEYTLQLREQILEFLDGEYSNPALSLTLIADHFHVSPKYISDFIKNSTGKNYVDFIQENRLSKARDLMKQRNYTLQQISEKVGYLSANTFYKSFKRYYGISPSAYREQLSKEAFQSQL